MKKTKNEMKRLVILGLIVALCVVAMPAMAASLPSVGCPAVGSLSSCTAKEIQTTQVSAEVLSPGGACEADGNVDVRITATYAANANRYDLGLFVAADGGTLDTRPGTNPSAQSCIGEYALIPPFVDLTDKGASDTCGDVAGGTTITSTFDVRVKCVNIVNGDLPIQSCRFWKQPGDVDKPTVCSGVPGPSSGTGSKCDCDAFHAQVNIPPTLTLIKTVTNDNGGTKVVGDFTLKVDGGVVTNGTANVVTAGLHTASEVQLPGYAASVWGGDCAPGGTITLLPGDNKVCTITNDDKAPGLHLRKVVVNDNGGTNTTADWTDRKSVV